MWAMTEGGCVGEVDGGDNSGAGDNQFGILLVVLCLVFSEDLLRRHGLNRFGHCPAAGSVSRL
jgi:hypothetical protein